MSPDKIRRTNTCRPLSNTLKKAKEYASKQELEKELGNRKEKLNFNNKELLDDLYETEKERIELEKESTAFEM